MKRGKVIFTGSFGDYFLKAVGLGLLGIPTLGLAWIYLGYWSKKYFFAHMEIEVEE